ncbi:hypothetical protein B0H13DRAFT_2664527, partial [Mycena leptocephala]
MTDPDSPEHKFDFEFLGYYLTERFQESDDSEDINDAIVRRREAVTLSPPSSEDPIHVILLTGLGFSLNVRFRSGGNTSDLEEA